MAQADRQGPILPMAQRSLSYGKDHSKHQTKWMRQLSASIYVMYVL